MNKLQKLMAGRELSAAINNPAGGLPNGYPAAFMTRTRRVVGSTASWRIYPNSRTASSITSYGSPAVLVGNKGFSTQSAAMIHSFEEQRFGQDIFNGLEDLNGNMDEMGVTELTRQTADFKRRFQNTRVHCLQSGLIQGKIYKAGTQLLPSSVGSTETIDLGVPATNLGQLNGMITESWASATPKIHTHIESIQRDAVKRGNPPIKFAFYGGGIAQALINDPATAKLIQGNPAIAAAFATGVIPGLYGLTWVPVPAQFFEAEDGTKTDMTTNKVTFCPDPAEGDWYEMLLGSYAIPGGVWKAGSAEEMAANLIRVYGMFSYAGMDMNPPSIRQFAGDTFLPVFKVPSAVYTGTVIF